MELLDQTLPSPAANLACDEALLERCEQTGAETLRFWESTELFVVVGFSNAVAREVRADACRQAGVGIYRRASGGGAVLQGPGCLNYALALRADRPGLETIPGANAAIMERNCATLNALLPQPAVVCGHTDLALRGHKFSGNAQRRQRRALLFHGTFLLNFDLELMERFLAQPSREPAYREGRPHHGFVANLGLPAAVVKEALRQAWEARTASSAAPEWQTLAEEKYSQPHWNLKF